jgi:hypothetical protein
MEVHAYILINRLKFGDGHLAYFFEHGVLKKNAESNRKITRRSKAWIMEKINYNNSKFKVLYNLTLSGAFTKAQNLAR